MSLRVEMPNANSSVMGRNGYHTQLKAVEFIHYDHNVTMDFIGQRGRALNAAFFTDEQTMDALCEAWLRHRRESKDESGKPSRFSTCPETGKGGAIPMKRLKDAAQAVLAAWETGDLAGAVRELDAALKEEESSFLITSVSRDDLEEAGFDPSGITDEQMEWLAGKMADDYIAQLFWEQIDILAEQIASCKTDTESLDDPAADILANQAVMQNPLDIQ